MRQMSVKEPARELAIRTGVPVIPALTGSMEEILNRSEGWNFPILIEAAAGGGGRECG